MPGRSQVVYLNLEPKWDNFRDNRPEPKSSYPEMTTLTDTQIRNVKAAERAIRLYDDRGLYLEVSVDADRKLTHIQR